MPKLIKSLYDVLINTTVQEDQCTYFILWLFQKLPSSYLLEMFKMAELDIDTIDDHIEFVVQYPLYNRKTGRDRRADAKIEFSENKCVILETKRFSNNFDKAQFLDEIKGAQYEFQNENVWGLFLSGDITIPIELAELKKYSPGRVGFISWKIILDYLCEKKEALVKDYDIIINEFLIFAKHLKIGEVKEMNNEDLMKFIEVYPTVWKFEDIALETLNKCFDQLRERIIIECDECVEANKDDDIDDFPVIYQGVNIEGGHIHKSSGYLAFDLLDSKIYILLTGYQDTKEKNKFIKVWENHKNIYKDDSELIAFKWDGEEERFKAVPGTSGKPLSPNKLSTFDDSFYWGYAYNLDINKMDQYLHEIPKDFKKLLDNFIK